LFAFVVLTTPGCEQGNDSPDLQNVTRESVVLRRGNGGDPQTLDPAIAEDVHAFRVLTDLYEGLVSIDAAGNLVPGVAHDWEISDDGLTYTFRLRPDASWSNGEAIVANDFVAGMRRSLQPDSGSAYSFLLHPIANAAGVERSEMPLDALGISSPDSATVVIELESPAPHFLAVLAMPVAYPVWNGASAPADQFTKPKYFVGNGAFVLDDWQPGHRVRLRKNKHFREADQVLIDVVEYYAIQDLLTELNMYRAGELDITASVPGTNVGSLRESHPTELRISPRLGTYYLAFDVSEAPFDDPELRRALSMAIDRRVITEVVGRGEQPAYGFIPDGVAGYEPARYDWRTLSDDEREEEARRAFAASTHSATQPLRINFTYDTGDIHERVALAVGAMWRDVLGVEVELDKREWKYFLETRNRRDEWQIMRFAWTGDYNDASTFSDILLSTSPQNLPAYNSAEYDELLQVASAESEPTERLKLMAAAETTMLNDYPIAPLYFYVSKHLVSPAVQGFENNVLDQHPSRFLRVIDQTLTR
jgi:ABC-type oligopeptide transport system substrate-binding subunit